MKTKSQTLIEDIKASKGLEDNIAIRQDIIDLSNHNSPDLNQVDEYGNTLLHIAAMYNNIIIFKTLLECGCKIDTLNNNSQTPAQVDSISSKANEPLFNPKNIIESYEKFLRINSVIDECYESNNYFQYAINQTPGYNTEGLLRVIKKIKEENPNLCTKYDPKPYQYNEKYQSIIDEIKSLPENDYVFTARHQNQTILHKAVRLGCDEIVEVLLKKQAIIKVNHNDQSGINAKDSLGNTALHYAAINNHVNIFRMLIKKGANYSILNNKLQTAIHILVSKNKSNLLYSMLLNLNIDLNIKYYKGQTPLHMATIWEYKESVEILLNFGAKAKGHDVKDLQGHTPYDMASPALKEVIDSNLTSIVDQIPQDSNSTPVAKQISHNSSVNKNNLMLCIGIGICTISTTTCALSSGSLYLKMHKEFCAYALVQNKITYLPVKILYKITNKIPLLSEQYLKGIAIISGLVIVAGSIICVTQLYNSSKKEGIEK